MKINKENYRDTHLNYDPAYIKKLGHCFSVIMGVYVNTVYVNIVIMGVFINICKYNLGKPFIFLFHPPHAI
jgi:hypothetical protein